MDPYFGSGSWVSGDRSVFSRLEDGIGKFLALVVLSLIAIFPLFVAGFLEKVASTPARRLD
jgi:hypothetical protein